MGATRKVALKQPEEDAALLDELVASGFLSQRVTSVTPLPELRANHKQTKVQPVRMTHGGGDGCVLVDMRCKG